MRASVGLGLALLACACASRKQAGESLVTAGTTVAVIGATVQTKKSAAVAGTGVAMVAAGGIVQAADEPRDVARPQQTDDAYEPRVVPATYELPPRQPEPDPEPEPAAE